MKDICKVTQIQKKIVEGKETSDEIKWLLKQLEQLIESHLEIKTLKHEQEMIRHLIDNFAFKYQLQEFRDKWNSNEKTSFSDSKLTNYIKDFLEEIEKYIECPSNKWF